MRGWRGSLQKRRSDMSKEKLRELYRVDRHACQNSRSAQASARSPNRTTSSSYTVASARPRALNTSALSRPLKEPREDGRRRTRSISKGLRGASRRNTTSGTPSRHRPSTPQRNAIAAPPLYTPPERRRCDARKGRRVTHASLVGSLWRAPRLLFLVSGRRRRRWRAVFEAFLRRPRPGAGWG